MRKPLATQKARSPINVFKRGDLIPKRDRKPPPPVPLVEPEPEPETEEQP